MTYKRIQPGYILVLVLIVLAIAGSILGGLSLGHCSEALQAAEAQRQLQLKWGLKSCRDLLMPQAETLLTEKGRSNSLGQKLQMGDIAFYLLLSDEQSKANVNLLSARRGDPAMAEDVQNLQSHSLAPLPLELRPSPTGDGISRFPLRYRSLDQLFAFKHPSELINPESDDTNALASVTCWGSGLMNFKKASSDALKCVCRGILDDSQLKKLMDFTESQPDCRLNEALAPLKLTKETTKLIKNTLTDKSSSFSLWIVAQEDSRRHYRLYVSQTGDAETDSYFWTFAW